MVLLSHLYISDEFVTETSVECAVVCVESIISLEVEAFDTRCNPRCITGVEGQYLLGEVVMVSCNCSSVVIIP